MAFEEEDDDAVVDEHDDDDEEDDGYNKAARGARHELNLCSGDGGEGGVSKYQTCACHICVHAAGALTAVFLLLCLFCLLSCLLLLS